MHQQVAEDYLHAISTRTGPEQQREIVVLASYRLDVLELNQTIRSRLQDTGRLGPDVHRTGDQTGYALGDEIIVTRQCSDSQGRKVLNGTRGTVTHGTPGGLRIQPQHGPELHLDTRTVQECVQHGYALTIHKAQGLTATTSLVISDGLTRQSAYTALSRGRERNQLYLHDNPDAPTDGPSPFQRLCDQLERNLGDLLASQQLQPRERRLASLRLYTQHRFDGRSQGRGM